MNLKYDSAAEGDAIRSERQLPWGSREMKRARKSRRKWENVSYSKCRENCVAMIISEQHEHFEAQLIGWHKAISRRVVDTDVVVQ